MANRRVKTASRRTHAQQLELGTRSERSERKASSSSSATKAPHEVVAVAMGSVGLLALLSLMSFNPADVSLNTSGGGEIHNWIGPLGSYAADALLQTLGVSAYALAIACMAAGLRALTLRRMLPGFRESLGLVLTVLSVGTLAHLINYGETRPYPAGGILGALFGDALREQLAAAGSMIVAAALVLASLALTVDGILAAVGVRTLVVFRDIGSRIAAVYVYWRERRRAKAEAAPAIEEAPEADEPAPQWTASELPKERIERYREKQKQRIADAREKGQKDAEAVKAKKGASLAAVRDESEPEMTVGDAIDLPAEDPFVLGALPALKADLGAENDDDAAVTLQADDADIEIPVRAAEPPPPAENIAPVEPPKRKRQKAGEPQIVDVRPTVDVAAIQADAVVAPEEAQKTKTYELPSTSLLDYEETVRAPVDPAKLRENAVRLTKTLKDYGIEGHVREIRPGPVVTMYEYVPAPGIKLSKIASLADDLAMSMEALRVRIVAPIPGKGAVGIEIPNETRETVFMKEIVTDNSFKKNKSMLSLALGKDIEGNPYSADLARMPHLLVAGATGAGKSVSINTMIMSILFRATPADVRMIMVDPKMLELSVYEGIPHLLLPVVTDPKKAALALRWAVEEMERRYQLLSETGVRGIDSYNKRLAAAAEKGEKVTLPAKVEGEEPRVLESLPYIVVVVDELADLMMVASRDVETSIMRLAQMARAAGIHLILATQRPSVDVLTGVIKANFPTRIAFQVASRHDSRTIIDSNGAEHLLGRGDMLYLSPGAGGISRVHGAYVSDEEIQRTVDFLKAQGAPQYDESILAPRPEAEGEDGQAPEEHDEMYDQAVAIVAETRQASISMIQRRLRIGYNRAARLVEQMETQGIVGPADGAKPREVLVQGVG